MNSSNKVLPKFLRVMAWVACGCFLLSGLLGVSGANETYPGAERALGGAKFLLKVQVENLWAGFPWYLRLLVTGVPSAMFAYAMARLAVLQGFAIRGEIFSTAASGHLRSFGLWLLLGTLADVVLPLPTAWLNHLIQPLVHFNIKIELDDAVFWKLFFSTLIMLLARVLSDGYRLAEENRQFI